MLLDQGRLVADGRPSDVLTPERIRVVYGVDPALVAIARG
jgi:ABC-type hemin transport system ATPase subunit